MMRKLAGLPVLFVMLTHGIATADGIPAPLHKVEVLACHTDSMDEVEYTVKNMGTVGINRFSIGDSSKGFTLIGNPNHVISQSPGPAGWGNRVTFGYESEYYVVVWEPETKGVVIPGGSSLGGFRISVPSGHPKEVATMKGTTAPFPNFMTIGFRVEFKDPSDLFGVVTSSGCPKAKK